MSDQDESSLCYISDFCCTVKTYHMREGPTINYAQKYVVFMQWAY